MSPVWWPNVLVGESCTSMSCTAASIAQRWLVYRSTAWLRFEPAILPQAQFSAISFVERSPHVNQPQ